MVNISAVILTKNEAAVISKCIGSLNFVDEIIVIDDYSQDSTARIAERLGAVVYKRTLNRDFSAQRNFGLGKTVGKWIIFLDADERITKALQHEIVQLTNNPIIDYSGFYIKRSDILWGRELKYGESGGIKLLRLARRDSGKWKRRVHEVWQVTGTKRVLKNPIKHSPHQSIKEFIKSVNHFSSIHSLANYEEGKKSWIAKVVVWPIAKFIYNYFFKKGFLDGARGFISALMMSFHSFLSWGKLWFLQRQEKKYIGG